MSGSTAISSPHKKPDHPSPAGVSHASYVSQGSVLNGDGSVKHPGLDNHAMGTIFEELVRRFNEENNEEAGEHWTPRYAVKLMARLILLPIADQIESGTYLLYDGADLERTGGKDGRKDPRFVIEHAGDPEYSLITRSNDGPMLFLVNLLSKTKHGTKLGSRIAEVHNGSSLFTGDAGQGASSQLPTPTATRLE
jgi:hypothetical protein